MMFVSTRPKFEVLSGSGSARDLADEALHKKAKVGTQDDRMAFVRAE